MSNVAVLHYMLNFFDMIYLIQVHILNLCRMSWKNYANIQIVTPYHKNFNNMDQTPLYFMNITDTVFT